MQSFGNQKVILKSNTSQTTFCDNMSFKTEIFNKIYEELYLKGVSPEDEKELAKLLLYFLGNIKLNKNTLLKEIEKEDWYKIKYNQPINELKNSEKEKLIESYTNFIVTSCITIINN